MTKEECYQYMYAHPGVKMRHEYYSPEEYIYINEQGNLITEEGYNMGGRLDEFWSIYQKWEDGWELCEEASTIKQRGYMFTSPYGGHLDEVKEMLALASISFPRYNYKVPNQKQRRKSYRQQPHGRK